MVSLVSLYDDPFGYPSCLELAKNPKNRKNRWCSDGHRPLSQLPRHSGQATEGISYQAGTKKKSVVLGRSSLVFSRTKVMDTVAPPAWTRIDGRTISRLFSRKRFDFPWPKIGVRTYRYALEYSGQDIVLP
jgi:hypothetical protein